MIKIGVLGAGHLGKIHLQQLKEIPKYDLVGFFDHNDEHTKQVTAEYNVPSFSTLC